MDIPIKPDYRRMYIRTGVVSILILIALAFAWRTVSAIVSSDAISISEFDTGIVSRGSLIKDVRAPGTLVPTDLRWITARTEARVESILLEPGEYVKADDIVLRMDNPTLARDVDMARLDLAALEADAVALEKRLGNDFLLQQASVMQISLQHENARFRMLAVQAADKAVPALDKQEAVLLENQYQQQLEIEEKRLINLRELQAAEIDAKKAFVNRARRQLQLQEELLDELSVRAGIEGILQEVPVEQGQQITPGVLLARVAREENLKTELRVQESQVKDVKPGQKVRIAAGGQEVAGTVRRIDPAVQDGVVIVDVIFTSQPLPGSRPDLRVQGVIELDYVEDTLILPRPVYSQENTTLNLFVVDETGAQARRLPVQFGIGSLDRLQILGGLNEGDVVIVSDTSAFSERDTLTLKE